MKRFVLTVLCVVLFGTACGTGRWSEISPRYDPILRELNKANCAYAAIYVDNNYKWTVTLYVHSSNIRMGSVIPTNKRFFCIKESYLKEAHRLSIRIRSHRSHNQSRQSGVVRTLTQLWKGDVWKLTIPSTSLFGSQYITLPYEIVDEEEKPKR